MEMSLWRYYLVNGDLEEVLSAYLFTSLNQVREITWQWLIDYNEQRPHDALGGLTPMAFRERIAA